MPDRNPWVGWGTSTKLCLGLGVCLPSLSGVSDDFRVINVYLTSSVAERADVQPVEAKGRLSIVFSELWINSQENNNIMVYLAVTMLAVLFDCRQ